MEGKYDEKADVYSYGVRNGSDSLRGKKMCSVNDQTIDFEIESSATCNHHRFCLQNYLEEEVLFHMWSIEFPTNL